MEAWWGNSFGGGDGGNGAGCVSGGQNGNFTNNAWDIWDNSTATTTAIATTNANATATVAPHAGSTCYDWTSPVVASAADSVAEASVVHALLFGVPNNTSFHHVRDPHMMCLKLGKRHYYEDASLVPDPHVMIRDKRGKLQYSYDTVTPTATALWPPVYHGVRVTTSTRCQVEGCNVALGNAKEYYKRHKVCEIHSKAPKVVVSGLQQRFCQQCSRFHNVTEFDEVKRSCRRRLEGHNLRRRKGVVCNSLTQNLPHSSENSSALEQRLGPLSASPSPTSSLSKPVRALSLLSSPKVEPWISSGDLSSRCSAALYELIAANRATYVSRHLLNHNSSHQQIVHNTMHTSHDTDRFSHATMAFDVKQTPALDLGLLDMKEKSKDPEEWTDYCWSAFGGTNLV